LAVPRLPNRENNGVLGLDALALFADGERD
jgi:hypothetical protein